MKKLIFLFAAVMLAASVPAHASAEGIFDLLNKSELCYEADMEKYYLEEMVAAAKSGNVSAGQSASQNRNDIIDMNSSASTKLSFDDLYLLSRLIYAEAGSDWLTDEFRFCIGEVVMNRVASPEFPDTLSKVVYQKGQYTTVMQSSFAYIVPPENCVDIALRLLQGERMMVSSVVYCSSFIQGGDVFSVYDDWRLGMIYFCVSSNIDLYPID